METPLSRTEKLTIVSLLLTALGVVGAFLVVPEVRGFLRLDETEALEVLAPTSGRIDEGGSGSMNTEVEEKLINAAENSQYLRLRPDEAEAARKGYDPYVGYLDDQALLKPDPVWPQGADAPRYPFSVIVEIRADELGHVTRATTGGAHPLLAKAAVEAAYKALFPRAFVEGRAVRVGGCLTYNYTPVNF